MSADDRRVYVHGADAITPLGATWAESVDRLADGESAVEEVERFDATDFPSAVAASIDEQFGGEDRRLELARNAMERAWSGAELDGHNDRVGVFIGAESGRATLQTVFELSRAAGGGSHFDHATFGREAPVFAERFDTSVTSPATVASSFAGEYGTGGPARTISLACASGAAAVAEAYRAVHGGLCDVAICGGVGADVDPLMMAGFGLLSALSERGVSRPFDVDRDGFVVGEGAAMFVLSARREGAIAEIAGAGRTLDAHHLTKPHPDGDGAKRAMNLALREAGLDRVGYVQAHGTSTRLNDPMEARAIREVFDGDLDGVRVSSVKGALGHSIAGAGATGLICALEAVRSGFALPTAGLENVDRHCELPHVTGEAVDHPVDAAMINAFAFGGANCSIVVRRCN